MRFNSIPARVAGSSVQGCVRVSSRLLLAALAGWSVLLASELVLLFGVLRLFAAVMGPDLLPSLKVVLDLGALVACGWTAGRLGRPRAGSAAALTAAGLAVFDLTPYLPLNVPWVLRLIGNALDESRYVSSLVSTLAIHTLLFGSLFLGSHLSRPREQPIGLRVDR